MVLAGDFVYGNPANSATIYKSAFYALKRGGTFVGNPENCFSANDIETFPTNQAVSCFAEENDDLWCWSLTHMAILISDITTGVSGWQGRWSVGCAGDRATTKTDYGRFWISGQKQLCTMGPNGPISVSGEYERALLSKIGDANLPLVEVRYLKDVSKDIDHIDISCLDSNGTPFHVIHDFKLKDSQSPFGQAYERSYVGLLATTHSIESVLDNSDRQRIWAGASDGKLYELNSGDNDNGAEFSADLIALFNGGKKRPKLAYVAWNGDGSATVSFGQKLKTSTAAGAQFTFQVLETETMPDGEDDYFYRATIDREIRYAYLRFQLNSHSSTGNSALGSIPARPSRNLWSCVCSASSYWSGARPSMKIILPNGVYNPTPQQRRDITDRILTRGTGKRPSPPRDLFFQPGTRGGTLTWKEPVVNFDVAGYRIYKDTESNLYEEIKDRGRRQEYIELSAAPVNALTITAISRTSNVVTATVNNTYRKGDSVVIAGVTDTTYNGTVTLLSASPTQITYASTGANGSSANGTASAPPITNIFVSSINAGGMNFESQKVLIQCQSISEASAPSVPGVPPGYTSEASGGGDRRSVGGRFSILTQ
jgi:hypothetical protein